MSFIHPHPNPLPPAGEGIRNDIRFIRGLSLNPASHNGFAITIGNFDGVHLGHQSIIKMLNEKATALQIPSLLITFEPHPQEYFRGTNAPARLTNLREKIALLQETHAHTVLCLPFRKALSLLPPVRFIEDILVRTLKMRYLLIGDDFRFGYKRQGDIALLKQYGAQHQYQVEQAPAIFWNEKKISSTWIRTLLAAGDFKTAAALMGRPYHMEGRVIEGDKRGKPLGFPTANIKLGRLVSPLRGVFVVKVGPHCGVANIGTRPTLDGLNTLLEVHLLDFNQDLYGQRLKVTFLHKLRDEQRFESIDALKQQIQKDVLEARAILKASGP